MDEKKDYETTDELMDQVAYGLLEKSLELEPGSDEHTTVIDSATRCYNSYIESTKIGMEFVDRDRQREHEVALKRIDDERDKRETISRTVTEVGKVVLGVGAVLVVSFLGWKNENDPIRPKFMSSQTSRDAKGWISKLLFK